MTIYVVSTGFRAPTKHLCLASVARQLGVAFEHIYIEASEQDPPKTVSQNLYEAIAPLPADAIVVWIDGDDFLEGTDTLAKVRAMYGATPVRNSVGIVGWTKESNSILLTYGSFVTSDGDPATWQGAYPPDADVREHPWLASHLRTFKAGLFQRLTPEDLQLDGEWLSLGVDQAVMLPMLEMAGLDRCRFVPEVLAVYHVGSSWGAAARPADLDREAEVVARVRAKARKERIKRSPSSSSPPPSGLRSAARASRASRASSRTPSPSRAQCASTRQRGPCEHGARPPHDGPTVILNDDVTVCPDFPAVVEAITSAVPDQVIALHTTAPAAPSLAMCGERWLRSYWLTGPGYILPAGAAARLLAWVAQAPRQLVASVNEDNMAMHWAWSEQRPIWHCIPALVQHDVSVPSTLGYDEHPGRQTNVPWDRHPVPAYLTDYAGWVPRDTPLLVECPWMPTLQLARIERAFHDRPELCCLCHARDGGLTAGSGARVCPQCVTNCVGALANLVQNNLTRAT